jgi:hypothetical protein
MKRGCYGTLFFNLGIDFWLPIYYDIFIKQKGGLRIVTQNRETYCWE